MSSLNNRRILVIGATGSMGKAICQETIRQFGPAALIVGDYKIARGQKYAQLLGEEVTANCLNVTQLESVKKGIEAIDAVIIAAQQETPLVQRECLLHHIPCLDITIKSELVNRVRMLDAEAKANETPLIVTAGLFPGLSGMMIKQVVDTFDHVSSIDAGFLLNPDAEVGPTGIADMFGMFAEPVMYKRNGKQEQVPGFTLERQMEYPRPYGIKMLRLVRYSEAEIVSEICKVQDVNYWVGWFSNASNRFFGFLNKIGYLRLFNAKVTRHELAKASHRLVSALNHLKKAVTMLNKEVALAVEVSGQRDGYPCTAHATVVGPSDYEVTAMSAVAMSKLLLDGKARVAGVHFPMEVFSRDMLLATIGKGRIVVSG